ncbi:hypothetical protein ACVJGD_008066 [Bradyrhizobium sp. USDA 10063]
MQYFQGELFPFCQGGRTDKEESSVEGMPNLPAPSYGRHSPGRFRLVKAR